MTDGVAWVNGALVPREQAAVSIDDASVKFGAALFETMRAVHACVFRWPEHYARLASGLRAIGVTPPTSADLARAVEELVAANQLSDARIRLTVSAGAMLAPDLAAADQPTILVTAEPLSSPPAQPISLRVSSIRVDESRPIGFAKTAHYLPYLLARAEARAAGAGDALLLNHRGGVCEAATANVFAVIDGRLVTPPASAGPILGVTRGVILGLASAGTIGADERDVLLGELAAASEVFLTNSIVGVQPVARLDSDQGEPLWTAQRGAGVTSRLSVAYAQAVERECGGG